MNPRSYYDTFSRTYDRGRDEGYHALLDDLEVDVVRPYATGADVLEAGCGTGRILSRLAPHAKSIVGADLSRGMLGGSQARGLSVVQADLTALPVPDAAFDLVCSFKVLAHVPPIERAVAELCRVTRPGGRLVLEFYNRYSLRYLGKRLKRPSRIGDGTTDHDVFTRFDTPRELARLFPAGTRIQTFYGIRVVTPFAQVMRVPVLGSVVASAERALVRSPLRWLGGFLVAVARKDA